jgi:hypothetical protein
MTDMRTWRDAQRREMLPVSIKKAYQWEIIIPCDDPIVAIDQAWLQAGITISSITDEIVNSIHQHIYDKKYIAMLLDTIIRQEALFRKAVEDDNVDNAFAIHHYLHFIKNKLSAYTRPIPDQQAITQLCLGCEHYALLDNTWISALLDEQIFAPLVNMRWTITPSAGPEYYYTLEKTIALLEAEMYIGQLGSLISPTEDWLFSKGDFFENEYSIHDDIAFLINNMKIRNAFLLKNQWFSKNTAYNTWDISVGNDCNALIAEFRLRLFTISSLFTSSQAVANSYYHNKKNYKENGHGERIFHRPLYLIWPERAIAAKDWTLLW